MPHHHICPHGGAFFFLSNHNRGQKATPQWLFVTTTTTQSFMRLAVSVFLLLIHAGIENKMYFRK